MEVSFQATREARVHYHKASSYRLGLVRTHLSLLAWLGSDAASFYAHQVRAKPSVGFVKSLSPSNLHSCPMGEISTPTALRG
jgi:hypothetical protein